MASVDTDVSAHSLIHLVYQYLKENGHEEAASVLRKHTPQVEVPNVDVSLNDIFKKWTRGKQKKKKDKSTHPQKLCAEERIHSKGSAKLHGKSSNKGRIKDKSLVGPLSSNEKKTKTNGKNSSSVESQKTANTKGTHDQDSDSDSSLDVEKWKKLALTLSDGDIAKMDVFTTLSRNVGTTGGKSKKSKKDGTLLKEKSKPIKPQTKSTTATVPSEGEDTVLPSKVKVKEKNSTDPNSVETPSRNTADKARCKEPKFKTPKLIVGFESTGSPKLNIAKDISETGSGKDSEFIRGSMGENAEPEETQKIAQSKKSKSKKAIIFTEPIASNPPSLTEIIVENSQSVPDSVVGKSSPKKNKSKHVKVPDPADITTQAVPDTGSFSNSEQVETPNKKVKSKKSSKHAQSENDSSQETGIRDFKNQITEIEDSGNTVETHCKQVKNKKSAKHKDLPILFVETGTKAESEQPHAPPKKSPKNLKTTLLTSPSFKENISVGEVNNSKTPLKTPSKKSKTKKSLNTDEDETVPTADCANVPDSTPKKRKRRKSNHSEENMHLSEFDRSNIDNDHDVCVQSGKRKLCENEDNSASVVEEEPSVPKKKKKHKKDQSKNDESDKLEVEDVPPTPPPEEMAVSSKKKKKKKKSHGDEEINDASPVPEDKPPKKKKKKSSKELKHSTEAAE